MDEGKYMLVQNQLPIIAGLIADLPLTDFINEINHADTVAPIIDPTRWMQAQATLRDLRELAEAALPMQRVALKLRGEKQR